MAVDTEVFEPTDFRQWESKRNDNTRYLETPDEEEGSKVVEVAPNVGPQTMAQKLAAARNQLKETVKKKPGVIARDTKPKIPIVKTQKERVSVEGVISRGWRMLAQMAQPVSAPVARVLDLQAPVAGAVLEDVVKGTIVDSILQPIARVEQSGEALWALVGPPVCIGIMQAKPELTPIIAPALKDALRTWIDIAGPKIVEQQKKEEKFKEQYGAQIDDMMDYFMGHTEYPGGPHTPEYLEMAAAYQAQQANLETVEPQPVRKSRRVNSNAASVA